MGSLSFYSALFSSYDQNSKIVIFEGEYSEFDRKMTNSLFPEFESRVNSISAGNKTNVNNLQKILKTASEEGLIKKQFISITDKDSEEIISDIETKSFSWDVYHIENYLLNEGFILKVLEDLDILERFNSVKKIESALKKCAQENLKFHINHELNQLVTNELIDSVKTKIDGSKELNKEYFSAVQVTLEEIQSKAKFELSQKSLLKKEKLISNRYRNSLKDNSWKKVFNGRNILQSFVGKINGIRYDRFRNLIISKMKSEGYQPKGMKIIIDQILSLE